jgi:hypothetical protein
MANQLSGQTGPSPRDYSKHQRYRRFSRVGIGADQFSAFLAAEATRLTLTSAQVFVKLVKNTADRIRQVTSSSDLS